MRARLFVGGGFLALAVGLGVAGSASANPVIIEPDPVSPGSQFAVFDGGNCDSSGGTATFKSRDHDGDDIPAVRLGSLRGLVGALTTVPEHARPGVYDVSVQCTTVTKSRVTTTLTVHGAADSAAAVGKGNAKPVDSKPADGRPDAKPAEGTGQPGMGAGAGAGAGAGMSSGTGMGAGAVPGRTEPEQAGPKGPSHAGLGGSTGPNVPETLAGITLLGTAGAATVHHLRRRRRAS